MATKNRVGRPTKYKPEHVKKGKEYLKACIKSIDEYHKYLITKGITDWASAKQKQKLLQKIKIRPKLPTIEGLATKLDVNLDSLYEWEKHYPDFSETLKKIKQAQKDLLMQGGLFWDYNPTIAKLILSANHGMRERQDITTGDNPIIMFDDSFTPQTEGD